MSVNSLVSKTYCVDRGLIYTIITNNSPVARRNFCNTRVNGISKISFLFLSRQFLKCLNEYCGPTKYPPMKNMYARVESIPGTSVIELKVFVDFSSTLPSLALL